MFWPRYAIPTTMCGTIAPMTIRTKIIATVGPASGSVPTLRRLIQAGCDVFRVNFSHGDPAQRAELLSNIRAAEAALGEPVAVMADLCGPKIRVGRIAGGAVLLADGQELEIVREPVEGDATRISTTLGEMIDALRPGEPILLDDGKLRLEVVAPDPPRAVRCRVVRGGVLAASKGVNLPRTELKLSALTEKDRRDVEWICKTSVPGGDGFDYVALSFVRAAADVQELRAMLRAGSCGAHIVAKVEKPQALERIDEVIAASDAVMVARGDLGVEMDLPAVPIAQKRIARLCRQAGKPCIIATQMLESMTACETPTRAEVSDVANAVLDHADAVMLSGETAVGKFPVEAASMMNRIVSAMQAYHDEQDAPAPPRTTGGRTVDALAHATREIVALGGLQAVAVFTATGATARLLAKNRLSCPILALSPTREVVRRTCLYYGVAAVQQADPPEHTREILAIASRLAVEKGLARRGDRILVVSGRPIGKPGHTNTLVVHTVE
ncbi:MAG TPA: pyruvate kinase [Phycisphaerales bacterium]|nr:pyruvate kinase [Phycisphaerales bacterium]